MFDCRGFGFNFYVGIHLANIAEFIYQPMLKSERDVLLLRAHQVSIDSVQSEGMFKKL